MTGVAKSHPSHVARRSRNLASEPGSKRTFIMIRNFTPHVINIVLPDGGALTILPDPAGPARVIVRNVTEPSIEHFGAQIPVARTVFGTTMGLPDEDLSCPGCGQPVKRLFDDLNCQDYSGSEWECSSFSCGWWSQHDDWKARPIIRVYIITSMVVRTANPRRIDLLSPGELIRDDNGQPIGCRGFTR